MSILNNSLLLGAPAGGAAGYGISRSLRFNSSDSAYLSRTPSSAGNRKTWTWAGWVKRSALSGSRQAIFVCADGGASFYTGLEFDASERITVYDSATSGAIARVTTAVFRDISSWYHILLSVDTTSATADNRVRLFVNGSEITVFTTKANPTQNADTYVNAAVAHSTGSWAPAAGLFFNGYLADIHFIDGQALDPSSFTEVSATTGQLIPKTYSGTYGTNGFWLKFADNSSNTATTLGVDSSGNGNNWTPNNLSVTGQALIGYPQGLSAGSGSVTDRTLAFDGNTVTFAIAGSSTTITFTPPSSISFSSKLEFWTTNGDGPGSNDQRYSYNGGAEVSCSGGEWTTVVTGSGTLTSLSVRNTVGSVSRLSAIRVDNSILIYDSGLNNDSLVDTPTSYGTDTGAGGSVRGNYCTWNPLFANSAFTISNGNLDLATSSVSDRVCASTFGLSSGKWYWEVTFNSGAGVGIGVCTSAVNLASYLGSSSASRSYDWDGKKYPGAASYGATYTTGDVIGVAVDVDAGTLVYYKNGVSQGTAFTDLAGSTWFPALGDQSSAGNVAISANFGQRPFAYTAPSGFKALCDTNLPSPQVAKPSSLFNAILWTGNGASSRSITGLDFSPDFVWIKNRTNPSENSLFDTVRGAAKTLYSNQTAAELATSDYGHVSSFDANGFTLANGASGTYPNLATNWNGSGIVGWAWDAGSTTVTNTQGSITSSVRANPSAGFSVVTFTYPSSGSFTVGHGLGVTPSLIITKHRNRTSDWYVYHSSATTTSQYLVLNSTAAVGTAANVWGSGSITSVVFGGTVGTSGISGDTEVAYCFAPVAGLSAFGSYTGNGSADGPMVYTGFRPRWVMVKYTSNNGSWEILDSERGAYNVNNKGLAANESSAEFAYLSFDFTSNGFKLRTTDSYANASNGNYVYAAFAESPFQFSRAR